MSGLKTRGFIRVHLGPSVVKNLLPNHSGLVFFFHLPGVFGIGVQLADGVLILLEPV